MVTQSLGKSLYDVIKMNDFVPFSLSQVRDFSRQLVGALDFLRGMKLIHTDLKPENILLLHPELHEEIRDGKPYYVPHSTEIRRECAWLIVVDCVAAGSCVYLTACVACLRVWWLASH